MVEHAQSREQAEVFARIALDLMARHGVPATPRNYAVWYAYAADANPDLKSALDGMLADRVTFDSRRCEELHERFFGCAEQGEAVETAGNGIQKSIREVMEMLHAATDGAQHYGRSLARNIDSLNADSSTKDLQHAVVAVVDETKNMIARNKKLESELTKSSAEIDTLRQRLEDVRKEALTDALTGIANRRHFDLVLRNASTEADDHGTPLCLMFADIDHFKRFNDAYGHQTGDILLKLVAGTLVQNIKGRDTAARCGGEEFGVILPGTTLADARTVAEQIRQAVASKRLRKKNTGEDLGCITVSIGVALYRSGEPLADLIRRADEALYSAKEHGRNQVVLETQISESLRNRAISLPLGQWGPSSLPRVS